MKNEIIAKLRKYKEDFTALKREIKKSKTKQIAKIEIRKKADELATRWVEEIRSPLEHQYRIDKKIIDGTSEQMKKLYILSRPNNLKSSYSRCINIILKEFENKFILPIQQTSTEITKIEELQKILKDYTDQDESEYLQEAISCAQSDYLKAAIVMGWCATIDKIQKKILAIGLQKFNHSSSKLKAKKAGKFKRWNKEFSIATLSELQTIFDSDLITVLEGMELIDGNQAERLIACFQYRNHSAHPGNAPIEAPNVSAFFNDVSKIILNNPNFAIS